MILRNRIKDPNTVIVYGMWSIIVFNVIRFAGRHFTGFWEGVVDGASGAALGIAIGLIFVAMRMKARGTACR